MTYAQSGLIQASDYNSFIGANAGGVAVSGELSSVWGRGKGNAGYGQTVPANVTANVTTVTATQWSTFFNNLNSMRRHQGALANIVTTLPVVGDTVTFLSQISGNLTTGYTSRNSYASSGTTIVGSNVNTSYSSTTSTLYTLNITRTATFASPDQARFFFNAGGKLVFNVLSITRTDATSRGAVMTAFQPMFSAKTFEGTNSSARTGTGGTVTTDSTTAGYWSLTTANTTAVLISATAAGYTDSNVALYVKTNGQQDATYQDVGNVVTFTYTINLGFQNPEAGADTTSDDVSGTITTRVDVIPPETTYLSNTWGTVTIA